MLYKHHELILHQELFPEKENYFKTDMPAEKMNTKFRISVNSVAAVFQNAE